MVFLFSTMEKSVMKKSPKPKTSNKDKAYEKSCKLQNELECNTKDFALDLKSWTESLTVLGAHIDQIDKVIQKTATMTTQELSKAFSDTQLKLDKIKTKMEAQQKAFNIFQTKFEKTLTEPLNTGVFNGLTADVLMQIRENVKKTQAGIIANTQALNVVIDKGIEYTRKLVGLEESVTNICLPDEVDKTDKLNDSLMKRLTALCEMTAPTQLPQAAPPKEPLPCDPNIAKSLLHLCAEHRRGETLLTQLQKNMRVPMLIPEAEGKGPQPDSSQSKMNALH
jgi:hypothetical protein